MHTLLSFLRTLLHLSHRTAGGVEVIGNASKEVEEAIDSGIAESIAIGHRCYGFSRGLSLRDYTVHIETGEDHGGLTTYIIPAGEYKGTPFEIGYPTSPTGKMFVSGNAEPFWRTLNIPVIEGKADDVRTACRHESEHVLLYLNNTELYKATAVHTPNAGHPLLHACPDLV